MRKVFLSIISTLLLMASGHARAQHAHEDDGLAVRLPNEIAVLPPAVVEEQVSLSKAHQAFRNFAYDNPDWQFRYDAVTATPHRAWGSGIPIRDFRSISLPSAPQAAKRFVEDHAATLNVEPGNLKLLYTDIVGNKVYAKFQQQYNGVDVMHAYVDLRISLDGRVFMFGSDYVRNIDVDVRPTVAEIAAREFAKAGIPVEPGEELRVENGVLRILPLRYTNRVESHLAWSFRVHVSPLEIWETWVDAHDGGILWRRNLVDHFDATGEPKGTASVVNGRVLVTVYPVSYTQGSAVVPMRDAYVSVNGTLVITDAEGRFSADIGSATSANIVSRLSGPYAISYRSDTTAAGNAVQNITANPGDDIEIVWDDNNSIMSERNAFHHLNLVRNFSRALDGSSYNARLDQQTYAVLEINQQCNAFFDGEGVNFFRSSSQCGNTGEIASVIHHEYGHGIHIWFYDARLGTYPVNGALREAIADMTSNFVNDDPRIGIGFQRNSLNDGIIRNSDNALRYPENVVNQIHDDGMILTGAVWDVRKAIGLEQTARLYHYAMYGTPDHPSLGIALADYFLEFLVADDDDGDLTNGTPHFDAIAEAFRNHGIPASAMSIVHEQVEDTRDIQNPYLVTGTARFDAAIDMPEVMYVASVRLVYSTDDWTTSQDVMADYDMQTRRFSGYFPPQPAGTIVQYYIEATDNFGSSRKDPMSAPHDEYMFAVGFKPVIVYDGEEEDGWSVESSTTSGTWVLEKPVGTYNTRSGTPPDVPWAQPDEDHTPGEGLDKCWVTGNANPGEGIGRNDVDDGTTDLTTRGYDITQFRQPLLRYYRWYTNDQGDNPGNDYWVVRMSPDGIGRWVLVERTNVSSPFWFKRLVRIADRFDPSTGFSVRFSASDDEENGSIVEAAVDDFVLLDIDESLVSSVDGSPLPGSLELRQNFPNPFNPSTTVSYVLPSRGEVRLGVYTPLGSRVAQLHEGIQDAGEHSVHFDASTLPSGLYVYEIEFGGQRLTKKMMLIR